jgi:hypothetical protein
MHVVHYCTVEGTKLREELCERCGKKFFYQLHRTATGECVNIFWVDMKGAFSEAARIEAISRLEKRLSREFDVVRCPCCGHLQKRMVRLLWSYAIKASLFFGLLLTIPSVILVAFWLDNFIIFKEQLVVALLWFLISVLLTLTCAAIVWLNPNLVYRLFAGGRRKESS